MHELVLAAGKVNHQALIEAIDEAGLTHVENSSIRVRTCDKTFISTPALALFCAWGLLRRKMGCSFRFDDDPQALTYPARMDLFRHLEVDFHENFTRHDASGRFLPLKPISDRGASIRDVVEAIRELVARQVPGSEAFLPALRWVVQELTDNIGNHARSPVPGMVCAQYYPKLNLIEIAVCDMGCGIKNSLEPRYQLEDHREAILNAMETGITRDPEEGQGNGLSGSREIVLANGGALTIWTGDTTWRMKAGRDVGFQTMPSFPGTGLVIKLRTDHPVDLRHTSIVDGAGVSLFQLDRSPLQQTPVFKLADNCTHTGGREPARALRRDLRRSLGLVDGAGEGEAVISFDGVDLPSSSFLDELLGRLAQEMGPEDFRRRITLVNASDNVLGMAGRVINQRLQQEAQEALLPRALPLLCMPRTLITCRDKASHTVNACRSLWPQARLVHWNKPLAGNTTEDLIRQIEKAQEPVLLILPRRLMTDTERSELNIRNPQTHAARVMLQQLLVHSDGSLSVLLPAEPLQARLGLDIRRELWERDLVRLVMELPAESGLQVDGSKKDLFVHLASPAEGGAAHRITMINGPKLLEEVPGKQLRKALNRLITGGDEPSFGYTFHWEDPQQPLRYAGHEPGFRRDRDELEQAGGLVPLGQLVVYAGMGVDLPRSGQISQDGAPFIEARDLHSLGRLGCGDLNRYSTPTPLDEQLCLQEGDILIAPQRETGGPPNVALVHARLAGAVPGRDLYLLRPADSHQGLLIADFLQTRFTTNRLDVRAPDGWIPLSVLQQLPVPSEENRLTTVTRQLVSTGRMLRDLAAEYDQARRELLTPAHMEQQLQRMEEVAGKAAMVHKLVHSLENFSDQVRMTYPLPLALAWREMEVVDAPERRYSLILQVFEGAVQYLACMLATDLRGDAAELSTSRKLLKKFATPGHGASLGQWLQFLQECPAIGDDQLETTPFPEFRLMLASPRDSIWWRTTAALRSRRNDHAHNRGPKTTAEFQRETEKALTEVTAVFQQIAFTSRYRLTWVLNCTYDELEDIRTVRCRELMGDHFAVPIKTRTVHREAGKGLYISDAAGDLRLCSPWLKYEECEECGQWEVTTPEFYSRPGNPVQGVVYKGIRTGHCRPPCPQSLKRLARFVGLET